MKLSAALLAIIAAVFLVYWPGLSGGYLFDDFGQIVTNTAVQLSSISVVELMKAANSSLSGPSGRPISMLSFALDHYFFGMDPWAMKLHNVIVHAVNACLVFLLVLIILRQGKTPRSTGHSLDNYRVPLLLTGIWALHPLDLTSVLYVVQRMTSLSGFFTLLGLACYGWFRGREDPRLLLALAGLGLSSLMSVYAKEIGLLTFCYAAVLEWFVFRFRFVTPRQKAVLKALFIVMPALAAMALVPYFWTHPVWFTAAYEARPFNVWERLLTEGRVLAFYQGLVVFPNIREMSLYHDDFVISHSLSDPISTLMALIWHASLLLLAFCFRKRSPLFAFGIFWFYAGHLLESTAFALELVFEHRNYLPMLGLLVAIYGLFQTLEAHWPAAAKRSVAAAFLLICALTTSVRAMDWGDFRVHPLMEASRHPLSPRANLDAGLMLARTMELSPNDREKFYDQARSYFLNAAQLDRNLIAPFISLLQLEAMVGHGLEPAVLDELMLRLRERQPNAAAGYNLQRMAAFAASNEQLLSLSDGRSLFDAALANPKLAPRDRGVALVGYGLFESSRGQDKEKGLSYLRRAVEVAPGIVENRVILGAALVDLQRNAEATAVLAAAEELDKYRHFEDQISNVRSHISSDRQ